MSEKLSQEAKCMYLYWDFNRTVSCLEVKQCFIAKGEEEIEHAKC